MAWYIWLLILAAVAFVVYLIIKKLYGAELALLNWVSNPLGAIKHV